ncbi:uncharacterized protein F4812DRAFT_462929 [Daldinia caldariorum]|uniref:uncharacterized protein n=1 Tax=Daldinia caldariorum TaxID=326644 RepID=UPI0020080EB1|nr:uncharacterized protein F4812DRAFT_462929 [Daldinia caldariorum]KAI1464179.1 hypothetical protein F4812DRAFT_462929 [Daldinia caldariorum]
MPYSNQLMIFLPRAGMIYPPGHHFLQRSRKDNIVMVSLEQAGFAEHSRLPAKKTTRAVDEALASIFTTAMEPDIIQHLTTEDGDLFDFLGVLCERLAEARKEWQQNPRPPFDPDQQSKTARSIDALLSAVGDRWNRAEFEIYELVGGWEEYDDEEIDKNYSDCSTLEALDDDNGSSESMQMEVDSLTTSLEDVADEEAIKKGVEEMDINDPMDVDND